MYSTIHMFIYHNNLSILNVNSSSIHSSIHPDVLPPFMYLFFHANAWTSNLIFNPHPSKHSTLNYVYTHPATHFPIYLSFYHSSLILLSNRSPVSGTSISPLESGFETLRRFVGKFNGHLQQCNGEVAVLFCGHPQTEIIMYTVRLGQCVHQLVHEVQPQVTVLQQSPATLCVHVCVSESKSDLYKTFDFLFLSL